MATANISLPLVTLTFINNQVITATALHSTVLQNAFEFNPHASFISAVKAGRTLSVDFITEFYCEAMTTRALSLAFFQKIQLLLLVPRNRVFTQDTDIFSGWIQASFYVWVIILLIAGKIRIVYILLRQQSLKLPIYD